MHLTDNEVNGGIAGVSAIAGNVIGFLIAPENVWVVQLAVSAGVTVILFGVGKSIDVYFRFRAERREDAKKK